jgi:hypothetical protein
VPNTTINNIVDCVNSGIRRAVKDQLELTGELEMSWGPEYFITASIARELKKLVSAKIVLEENMKDSFETPKGRRPAWFSPTSRFDIVVRKSNGRPGAAIEVKNRVYSVSESITNDIERLSGAVNKNVGDEPAFQFGIFAFYTVFEDAKFTRKSTSKAILDLYDRLKDKFEYERGNATVSDRLIKPIRYRELSGMTWGGGCIFFRSS